MMPLLFSLAIQNALSEVKANMRPGDLLFAFLDDVYVWRGSRSWAHPLVLTSSLLTLPTRGWRRRDDCGRQSRECQTHSAHGRSCPAHDKDLSQQLNFVRPGSCGLWVFCNSASEAQLRI